MTSFSRLQASFRDPSGFVFKRDGIVYRQVNRSYREDYDRLAGSGLYQDLVSAGLLVAHQEADIESDQPDLAYKVIRPTQVPFISYPYEWSFSQLKDAALLTLEIEKRALSHGMSLKDASAYNVQFIDGRPVLIDTLSFEAYREGEPWTAYRQFCQHFLAPLALMVYRDVRLSQLLRAYIDGIPLDLAARLLPFKSRLDFSLLTHIHAHSAAQRRYSGKALDKAAVTGKMSKVSFLGLIDNLESSVRKLKWKPAGTEWASYYVDNNYSPEAFEHKRQVVDEFLVQCGQGRVWDLGANTGLFSRAASRRGMPTAAFDIDPAAVELNYLDCKAKAERNLLPLVMDLTNPSPGIGWQNQERMALLERGPVEVVMALALVHHLAISNNVPLTQLASFFQGITRWLIVEFVPKEDSQVKRLLATREDIFPDYQQEGFEKAFRESFTIHKSVPIRDSVRCMYLMEASS